jgi:hypothetical protein
VEKNYAAINHAIEDCRLALQLPLDFRTELDIS